MMKRGWWMPKEETKARNNQENSNFLYFPATELISLFLFNISYSFRKFAQKKLKHPKHILIFSIYKYIYYYPRISFYLYFCQSFKNTFSCLLNKFVIIIYNTISHYFDLQQIPTCTSSTPIPYAKSVKPIKWFVSPRLFTYDTTSSFVKSPLPSKLFFTINL